MREAFGIFLVVLILLAVFTRETFVVALLYLFAGAALLGRWWSGRVVSRISFRRSYDHQAFPGESVPVQLTVENRSLLPAVWLRVQDYYPIEVASASTFSQVVSLGPREQARLSYVLHANKRGYYTIGPLHIATGDLLGLSAERHSEGLADHLTVYPRVIPLTEIRLPSRSPMGTMRHTQPIFEDPSRPMGKRDYRQGDSLRRIDWKATASSGRLQTRLFEPSIALETALFLNLNLDEYLLRYRYESTELAIVVAASLANWVVSRRQSVGLITNGLDPRSSDSLPIPLRPRKGRAQLVRILEVLARIRAVETQPFAGILNQERVRLPWGTTALVVTGSAGQDMLDGLIQARRSGLLPVLILVGEHPDHRETAGKARMFDFPVFTLRDERDMDIWRM
jgi:uncharacterized protein (DUF58 family)